jgi:hypothetical protein
MRFSDADPMSSAKVLLASMSKQIDEANLGQPPRYRSSAMKAYEGHIDTAHIVDSNAYDQLRKLSEGAKDASPSLIVDLLPFRQPFFASHTCDHRLNVPHRVQINPISQAPSDAINVLWRVPRLLREMVNAIRKHFAFELVLLEHRGPELELGIADETPPRPPAGEYDRQKHFEAIEEWKTSHWTPITEAGHGIRAMTNLLLSVFEPANQVLLIDEPELYLYPAQKRALGAVLVSSARTQGKQLLLVTHDASFLQGVLDSTSDANILRLAFGDVRSQRVVRPCRLNARDALPVAARQREYLNALFYEYVILVEGASDRAFYQGVPELVSPGFLQDAGFVVGGGKGAAVNTAHLCSKVGVPYVAIIDFDAVFEAHIEILRKILSNRGAALPSELPAFVRQALDEVARSIGADRAAAEKRLKRTGLRTPGVQPPTRDAMAKCFDALEALGIFIVRDGELESWVPAVEAKARFAEEALALIEADRAQGEPAADFLRRVQAYLASTH